MPDKYNLVLDIGTTTVKAFVFDRKLDIVASASRPATKRKPKRGWVEQDPAEYLKLGRAVLRQALRTAGLGKGDIGALGIANQRETTILWDKQTGKPVYPAIVWEDERTNSYCNRFEREKCEFVRSRTGLTISPYFSATEIHWILENVKRCPGLLKQNRLMFGTIDTWVIWNFCRGQHLTDQTNAARTILYDIKRNRWDPELLGMFSIPKNILPEVRPSQSDFGMLKKEILGFSVPVKAICGDQQASMYAAGLKPGTTKITFGTGIFLSQILGTKPSIVDGFMTTLVSDKSKSVYALEFKVGECAKLVEPTLGNKPQLEKILRKLAAQTAEVVKTLPQKPKELVIDGGVTRDGLIGAYLSELMKIPVHQQRVFNGTALGIAKLLRDA